VTEGPITAGLVLLAVVVVQQVESQAVAPVVLGRALELHPVAVTTSLTAGAVLGGVLGAAISVPLLAALWAVVRALRPQDPTPRLVGGPVDDQDEDDADHRSGPVTSRRAGPVESARTRSAAATSRS
jgi:predicted PurR-regulated permease PerM